MKKIANSFAAIIVLLLALAFLPQGSVWLFAQRQNVYAFSSPFSIYATTLPTSGCSTVAIPGGVAFAVVLSPFSLNYTTSTGGSCTWTAVGGGGSGGTDRQTWMSGEYDAQTATYVPLVRDTSVTLYPAPLTGPNSISYHLPILIAGVNDWLAVDKKASLTWGVTAGSVTGTVDINFTEYNADGAPTGGTSWNFSVYIGCAALGAGFTYGAANTISVTPGSAGFSTYSVPAVTLPSSCAAGVPIQAFLQRNADTGSTGVNPGWTSIEMVIRGN